jgi:phosphohistidine phosphatase
MKTLYIIRHAKSSWDDIGLADFDRPLNERGKTDAPRMGKRLKEKNIHPELMLSSPAKRALSTCKKIAEVLHYPESSIKTDRKLYHASPEEIFEVLRSIKNQVNNVMLFGHNPGLTEFVNEITDDFSLNNLPTCGVVALSFDMRTWKELQHSSGKLLFYDYPKSKKD